ncbi:NAD(P)-dependent oxidoreductase [Novosphingobium pentaromativorans]|uniref:6-phosphogluconate dehydrogenase, NAD-binding n=1 Tax=Novosphingobium pentaromativorans US6-1 TaxID=1088721 RepID=G6EH07_9SPHN|nr:NAD(P)-dependent oxidoreductase [Novosphingobium pentaromativorans]AIT82006.1 6-phosphogluconate dehydrogenase [Novosphingobium pentaromativorans US6-1]EHJ59296.1 6-phosphogluconate dehydrogenase, NAD-binding [Novosphingobium pentaromativorans US6-1]
MNNSIALIGFGEAGSTFAQGAQWRGNARAFDIEPSRHDAMDSQGIIACDSLAAALEGAQLVLSLVTADAAARVARAAAPLLGEGALFCDMNSVAPDTKRTAAQAVAEGKGHYVDVAVLAPVEPARMKVPLLVSGAKAPEAQELLGKAGFANVRTVGEQVGRASAIKLVRSVMVKGLEALTAEMMMAAHAEGVAQEVLASLDASEKSVGWAERADYNLDRMLIHGRRRAAEMQEAAQMLRSLGIDPLMTDNTVNWQRSLGQLAMTPLPEGYEAKLAGIAATGTFKRGDGQ